MVGVDEVPQVFQASLVGAGQELDGFLVAPAPAVEVGHEVDKAFEVPLTHLLQFEIASACISK
jgi:hypothetical protein